MPDGRLRVSTLDRRARFRTQPDVLPGPRTPAHLDPVHDARLAAESSEPEDEDIETPTLFVCHGDDGGPRMHPCRRVQEALRAAGIEYDKVIAAHGSPIPFLRKGSRDELRDATGATKLPTLKLPDGTVITHSRAILSWIDRQA
jgi:hypothetical protein